MPNHRRTTSSRSWNRRLSTMAFPFSSGEMMIDYPILRLGNYPQDRGTRPPNSNNTLAWTCLLAPNAVADYTLPLHLAESAVESQPTTYNYLSTLVTVLYRAGHLGAAIKPLYTAMTLHCKEGTAYDWLIFAMAHHRLGHTKQAKKWLNKANQEIEQTTQPKSEGDTRLPWDKRLELQL